MALAKRLKLLKLCDVLNGGGPAEPMGIGTVKPNYHEMATRESLADNEE